MAGVKSSGLKELERDLRKVAKEAVSGAFKVVSKGSLEIKRDSKRIISAASHRGYLPHYARSITYDVTSSGTLITSEIGPQRELLQGGLGKVLEYGTQNNAPIPHMNPALDIQEPLFVRYMGELGEKLLGGSSIADSGRDGGE